MSRVNQTLIRTLFRSSCASFRTRIGAMILIAASLAFPSPSAAVEGGGTLWIMGSTGFGAGVVPEPGFHYSNLTWISSFSTSTATTQGGNVVSKLNVDVGINASIPVYTGDIEPWGARFKLLAFAPVVWLDGTSITLAPEREKEKDDNDGQYGDTGFEVAMGWQAHNIFGVDGLSLDYAPGLLVVAPTGKYEKQEVFNPGKNRWLIQPNFGYTLFHEGTGIEVSQRLMYGFNTRNTKTNYKSGQEFHFDYAVGKRYDFGLTAGIFGFWYKQTTGDSGSGAVTGDLTGKAWGIGPMLQYSREVGGFPVSAAVRYLKVPQHRNRVDDDAFFFQISASF